MSEHTLPGFSPRPFPILVTVADSGPCPLVQHQQMCEKLFPFYRNAAQEVRNWRRQAYEAGQRRAGTQNPFKWVMEAGNQLYAAAEQHLAAKRLKVMASQLDQESVNRHLGWPQGTATPACTQQEQARPMSAFKVAGAYATSLALLITPLKPELVPLTPDQKLEAALMFGAICGTGGQMPGKESLCHAPKLSLRPRKNGDGLDITLA